MLGRIVEVADDHRHLSLYRGFLTVTQTGVNRTEVGRVPLDDICAVMAHAHGLSYTNNLLVALAERGIPFVLCGSDHNAVGMLMPIDGHFEQAKRIEHQVDASRPLRKRLWARIVAAKVSHQAHALKSIGRPDAPLAAMVRKVRSGDPENMEAQAAKVYWRLMFGDNFRRDRSLQGPNALLNYGYTVLRAATARAVIAAGLHPSLGLHHSNDNNAMRLVDDLMEPFRPLIDKTVWSLTKLGEESVSPSTKRKMVHALYADLGTPQGTTPALVCIQNLATSYALILTGMAKDLALPTQWDSPAPLEGDDLF